MTTKEEGTMNAKLEQGRYSPEGLPAYGVFVNGQSIGRVWKKKGRGQRTGDWYWERDGGRGFQIPVMSRAEAVGALTEDWNWLCHQGHPLGGNEGICVEGHE